METRRAPGSSVCSSERFDALMHGSGGGPRGVERALGVKPAERQLHDTMDLIGLRAHATAVGLVQLCSELCRAGVLKEDALGRIKEAIVKEIALGRPRSSGREEYEAALRCRLDALFTGREEVGEEVQIAP